MTDIAGFFEKLHLTESLLGAGHIEGTRLRIPVRGVFLLGGHPLESHGSGPDHGELIFDGVGDSRRTVTECIGDPRAPDGFKPPREVVDEFPSGAQPQADALQEFAFEGYQESPSAWIRQLGCASEVVHIKNSLDVRIVDGDVR